MNESQILSVRREILSTISISFQAVHGLQTTAKCELTRVLLTLPLKQEIAEYEGVTVSVS